MLCFFNLKMLFFSDRKEAPVLKTVLKTGEHNMGLFPENRIQKKSDVEESFPESICTGSNLFRLSSNLGDNISFTQ